MAVRFQGKILPQGVVRIGPSPLVNSSLPIFTTQPSISPTSGYVGDVLTASSGTVDSGTITGIVWRRNGVGVPGQTGSTFTPTQPGTYSISVTATNSSGSQVAISNSVEIEAIPQPTFTTQPSISLTDGFTLQEMTGQVGTFVNGSISLREWLFNGTPLPDQNGLTYTPTQPGQYAFRVTITGIRSTQAVATSPAVDIIVHPAPQQVTAPTIDPTNGTAGETTFTGANGTYLYGSIISRAWVLNGTPVLGQTSTTFTTNSAGSLVYRQTVEGPGGVVSFDSAAATIVLPAAPEFTVQPSISPQTAIMGTTFTGNDGTFLRGTVTARQWLIGGNPIAGATNSTYISDRTGQLTYRVTVSGLGGTIQATSAPATIEIDPNVYNPPVWNSSGYLGSYLEFDPVSIQLNVGDPDNNVDTVTLLSGMMPLGLTVDNTGLISGTLENVAETTTFTFTLRATDRTGLFDDSEFSIQVQNVSSIVVWNTPEGELAEVGVGGSVDQQLEATSQP